MYNPGVTNHGGEYIMRGAEIASKALSDGIEGIRKNQEEHDYLSGMADYYFGNDPEQLQKFQNGSVGTKRGMITAATAADVKSRQQHQQDMEDWKSTDASNRDWYNVQQRDEPWAPDADTLKQAQDAGMIYLPQSKHGGSYVPMPDKPQPGIPIGSDPTGTGNFYYDGKKLEQVHGGTTLPPSAAASIETILQRNKGIDDTIGQYQQEISNGNNYPGLDWFSKVTGGKSYQDQITELTAQKARNLEQIDTIRKQLAPGKPTVPTVAPAPGTKPVQAPALPTNPGGGVNLNLMPNAGGTPLPTPNDVAPTPAPAPVQAAPAAPVTPVQAPAKPANPKPAGWNDDALRKEAQGAIQSGQNRAAVLARLQGWGVDTTGL